MDVGGAVPMRWRGCLATCLDFLDEEASEASRVLVVPARAEESDVDLDVELAVQAVDLGQVRLDMEDFDD